MPTERELAKAGRLARAIASDISIYNTDKIQKGLENDTLFDILGDEIEEGISLFRKKFEEVASTTNIFEHAIIDKLVAANGHIKTKIF